MVDASSEAYASQCDSVLETVRAKDAAQTRAQKEERSRVEEAQRMLRSELRNELLEQKKLMATLETKQSNESIELNKRLKQEGTERKGELGLLNTELGQLTSSVEKGLQLAGAECRQLVEKLASDLEADLESLAAETEGVHAQAQDRAQLLEKDMAQVKTDLKTALGVEVAGLRDNLKKVSTDHSAALEDLKVQLQDTVVTKLEGVEKKLENEISQNIMPLSEKVRFFQTVPCAVPFIFRA